MLGGPGLPLPGADGQRTPTHYIALYSAEQGLSGVRYVLMTGATSSAPLDPGTRSLHSQGMCAMYVRGPPHRVGLHQAEAPQLDTRGGGTQEEGEHALPQSPIKFLDKQKLAATRLTPQATIRASGNGFCCAQVRSSAAPAQYAAHLRGNQPGGSNAEMAQKHLSHNNPG
ncbi:hypothetical protein NDU88_004821 [Pleurodeles waltl]|uniref:Uncharacterized protein n=1 Tax=Pleurodeles waltl TaxID=8319 RepID=A0AAV7MB48_PLEWA|nr:hypothetical protein NDU88_004821 [Pleurodeles waltl]